MKVQIIKNNYKYNGPDDLPKELSNKLQHGFAPELPQEGEVIGEYKDWFLIKYTVDDREMQLCFEKENVRVLEPEFDVFL